MATKKYALRINGSWIHDKKGRLLRFSSGNNASTYVKRNHREDYNHTNYSIHTVEKVR